MYLSQILTCSTEENDLFEILISELASLIVINRVFYDKKIWQICQKFTGKNKINSTKNCPQWALNPGPIDDYSTDCASLVCVGQKISEVSFVSCTTSHFGLWSFLDTTEHDFIKVMKIQAECWLSSVGRDWHDDPAVLGSIPTGGDFWRIIFDSSLCKDLSDNLTETHIVKN